MKDIANMLPLDYEFSHTAEQTLRESRKEKWDRSQTGKGHYLNSDLLSVSVLKDGHLMKKGVKVDLRLKKIKTGEMLPSWPVFWNRTNATHGFWSDKGCTPHRYVVWVWLKYVSLKL